MQFYFSLLLAFVKRMHAHVRRNLGFDSTFWGLGVLTSVVWQYTFHFESLHFRFFWTLRRFATACDWCRLQCGDWTKLHSETWLLPPLTPHHTSHPAVALLLQGIAIGLSFCLCLLWSLDPFGLFLILLNSLKQRSLSCLVTFLVMVNMMRRWRQESRGEMKMIETEIKSHY